MTLVINSYVVYAPLLKTKKKHNSKNMNLLLLFSRSFYCEGLYPTINAKAEAEAKNKSKIELSIFIF
jgi:hypothetical protein